MARSHSTRSSNTSFLRQLRPGASRGSKRRSADNTSPADHGQHARICKCLAQAHNGQLFELLQLVRSITLANITTPAAATANLASQGNSVRILSACRQPPAGLLAALTAAGQLDSAAHGPASRTLWGLMPFKLKSSSAKGGGSSSVPCDAEPQTIGAVYSRLSHDPLWLLSATNDPPTSFGLMLEGRPRRPAAERDAKQCVLEFVQLADAGEGEEAAGRWHKAALARAKHTVGVQAGQEDVIRRWQGQEEEQQDEEEQQQAMYAFASAGSSRDDTSAASRRSGGTSAALSDTDAAQLMYAFASLVNGTDQDAARRHGRQGSGQEDAEAVQLLQMLAGLADEGADVGNSTAWPHRRTLQQQAGQDAAVLHKFVHLR